MKAMEKTLRMIASLIAGLGILTAGEFAPPAEGPVAFRRDRIPLDVDAIGKLSSQLVTLAAGLDAKTPEQRRGAAQMLALALALDPGNTAARDLVSEYRDGKHHPGSNPDQLAKSRTRIWQSITWLESPDAGSDGKALASCLKDVIVISDPDHPKAAALREGGEKGAWAGWIPDVSAYSAKALAKNDSFEEPKPVGTKPAAPSPVLLESAQVETLLWEKSGKADAVKWNLAPAPLKMKAKRISLESNEPPPFSLVLGTGEAGGGLLQVSNSIRQLLKAQFDTLPKGVKVTVDSPELEMSLFSMKRQSISAAAAVLASSAITGCEPHAIILGSVDETGAYKLPTGFWDQLRSLGKGKGHRLVVPAEAAPYLPSFLAMERPEFFMEYEVLLAADFKQLLALSAKTPEGPAASAIANFSEIRAKQGNQDVRQYIGNIFVKQRLASVMQELPGHFSARMLLIQASGNRPTLVERSVLAAELRRAIQPMDWLVNPDSFNGNVPEPAKIAQTYETCRANVDHLERYTDKPDRGLLERAREVVIAVRNLERASRSRAETYLVTESVRTAHITLVRLSKELKDDLDNETGEAKSTIGP